jgi:urease accessory protein
MKGSKMDANLEVMEADALRMRAKRPFIFTNLKSGEGVDQIAKFAIEKGGLAKESDTLIR